MQGLGYDKRLRELEKEVAELKEIIAQFKGTSKWLTIKEVQKQYGITRTVIYNHIQKNNLVHLKDWRKNGNRYLINSHSVKKIL